MHIRVSTVLADCSRRLGVGSDIHGKMSGRVHNQGQGANKVLVQCLVMASWRHGQVSLPHVHVSVLGFCEVGLTLHEPASYCFVYV